MPFLVLPSILSIFHEIFLWLSPSTSPFFYISQAYSDFSKTAFEHLMAFWRPVTSIGSTGDFSNNLPRTSREGILLGTRARTFKDKASWLRKTRKFNSISIHEMNWRTDYHQSCHVCDVWGGVRNSLPGPTGTFYPEPELEPPKTFSALRSCFQDLHKTGIDARPLAITYPMSIGRCR